MTRSELERQVRDAFRGLCYPGDENLVGRESSSHTDVCDPESVEIKKLFSGKQWDEITRDHLCDTPQAIAFLSSKGFVYYLPAILLATLGFEPKTAYFRDNFIATLTPHKGNQQRFLHIVRALNDEQKQIIANYLTFVTQELYSGHPVGEAQIALDRYWNRHL